MKYRLLLTVLLGGCVYYNGMYNANRLARSAKRAEREGRTFEAASLWGQVATKAESVIVRHPTSKYAEEASVLRGVALARMGQCDEALKPLSRIGLTGHRPDLSEEALLATGRCQVALGNLAAADASFSLLLESKDPERRREAHYQRARLLRLAGRYEEALSTLESYREPRVRTERVLSLAGAGRGPEAFALADSLMAQRDTTRRWDSVVVALGHQDPVAASTLVDRVRRLPGQTPESQARLLLEDGLRLAPVDTARAARRLREAAGQGTGDAPGKARVELLRLELKRASRPEDLPPIMDSLKGVAERFRMVSDQASQLGSVIASVHAATTAVTPPTAQGDLRLFLAGEAARDSLQAPRLAAGIFRRILDWWPTSPYAPKAILATQQLDTTWVDSARAILETQYPDSPYLALIRGEPTMAYVQLEDSLGAFATSLVAKPAPPPGVRRRPPVPDDSIQPGRRPAPRAGGTRVIDPQ